MARRETRRRGVRLEVTDAYPADAESQRVRLDAASLLHLGVGPGDTVEIQGPSITFGSVAKARLDHYNLGNVYLPARLRENAGVRVGEMVTVEPATLEAATTVRLVAAERPAWLPFEDGARRVAFRERLDGRPVCLGDGLDVAPDEDAEPVEFRVVAVQPDDSVVLEAGTRYEIDGPAVEPPRRATEIDLD